MAASTSRAQSVRVVDDSRAEVIGILFRVAGASDFRSGSVQPFIHQVDSAFTPFASHPVFAEIRQLRAADRDLALSAVIGIAPQLSDPIELRERLPFDSPASRLGAKLSLDVITVGERCLKLVVELIHGHVAVAGGGSARRI